MTSLLSDILCVLEKMAAAIIGLLVVMVNGAIAGLGALIGFLIALLPTMPEAPEAPSSGILAWINFIFPLAPIGALVVTLGGLFATFMVIRIALNWVKAL